MFQAVQFVFSSLLLLLLIPISAAAQSSYQVVAVNHAGTISGTVKWSGAVPRAAAFPINKDNAVCDPDSINVRDPERLLVGSQGGVATTGVYLKDITSGKAMDKAS